MATTDAEIDAIDCARFVTCAPAIHATRVSGQLGDCYDWIWTSIASTHVRGQRINKNTYTFLSLNNAPNELFDSYLNHVPAFAAACFYVAYKFGGLDALSANVAPGCWMVVSSLHARNMDDEQAFEAMVQMVVWAAHRNWSDGHIWAHKLLAQAEQAQSPRQRLQAAMTFITPANCYVDGTPQEWAVRALRDHRGAMLGHECLQAHAVALAGPSEWRERQAEILAEISKFREECVAAVRAGESELEVLEQRVSILHPLIFVLMQWGEVEDIVIVLGTWYRAPHAEAADSDVLVIVPTLSGGAGYIWPGGRWLTGTGSFVSHDAMQLAAGTALGSYFRGSEGDHLPDGYEEFRFDIVDAAKGHVFEAAMAKHYRFEELKERLPTGWSPRATLVFPSGPEPVQALLAKMADVMAPIEISFEHPRPTRPIRRVAVWRGGPWHDVFELDAICHVADRAGWTVDVHGSDDATREDLRSFYENEEADVVWVISHGAHDPFAVRGTGLHLPDETLVGLEDLRGWTTPGDGRRLLVLNSCSGATAQGRAGIARIGLAQSLVSGYQAVVGHLWPVHWTAGLAFGAVLAASLEDDPTEAAVLTAAKRMRSPDQLLAFLEDRFEGCGDLLERLRRSGEDLSSITNWGCPVLLT
ncbi:CHAT domain-containing protein [Methylobacterium sp. 174MFSha1.1]|uniref:CHAT domain-containing protein n=1 Tax=Methylobacterium sp. 174MFSha1.1 TaxID=1502749 RepID=UPI0011607AE3|nr:CHAT domain-containing protein [Methylobacterium sp. 174MFSha1.1]